MCVCVFVTQLVHMFNYVSHWELGPFMNGTVLVVWVVYIYAHRYIIHCRKPKCSRSNVVFSYSLTFSLTQPLRTAVNVGTGPQNIITHPTSPRLLCTLSLQYTALPFFLCRAGGERLGEWTFCKTIGGCCPFYEWIYSLYRTGAQFIVYTVIGTLNKKCLYLSQTLFWRRKTYS